MKTSLFIFILLFSCMGNAYTNPADKFNAELNRIMTQNMMRESLDLQRQQLEQQSNLSVQSESKYPTPPELISDIESTKFRDFESINWNIKLADCSFIDNGFFFHILAISVIWGLMIYKFSMQFPRL